MIFSINDVVKKYVVRDSKANFYCSVNQHLSSTNYYENVLWATPPFRATFIRYFSMIPPIFFVLSVLLHLATHNSHWCNAARRCFAMFESVPRCYPLFYYVNRMLARRMFGSHCALPEHHDKLNTFIHRKVL